MIQTRPFNSRWAECQFPKVWFGRSGFVHAIPLDYGAPANFRRCDSTECRTVVLSVQDLNVPTLVGDGCAGGSGVPQLRSGGGGARPGNGGFSIGVEGLAASSPAVLLVGGRLDLALPAGCTLHLELPAVDLPVTADAAGRAEVPAPVPNDPSLVGVSLMSQWVVADPAGVPVPGVGSFALSAGGLLLVTR